MFYITQDNIFHSSIYNFIWKKTQWQNSMIYTSILLPLNFATSQILTSVFTFIKITLLPLNWVCPCNLKKKKKDFSYFSLIWLISISLIQSSKRVGPLLGVSAQGLQWNSSKNIFERKIFLNCIMSCCANNILKSTAPT